jgi:hypothetical protein
VVGPGLLKGKKIRLQRHDAVHTCYSLRRLRQAVRTGFFAGLAFTFLLIHPSYSLASTDWNDFRNLVDQAVEENKIGVIEYEVSTDQYSIRAFSESAFKKIVEIPETSNCLENSSFKVVRFDPVLLNSGARELRNDCLPIADFDGRNVLYHLMKAKHFFEGLPRAKELLSARKQIIVRVNADRKWSRPDHYGLATEYNNAYYFPADIDGRWNQELWFYKPKRTVMTKRILVETVLSLLPKPALYNSAAALIALPLLIESNTDIGLDSAKDPSVIYHEAFHWASDDPELFKASAFGRPIGESFSNYFAASILGKPVVGGLRSFVDRKRSRNIGKLRMVGSRNVKRAQKNALSQAREINVHLRSPFGAAVFWEIRKQLGRERTDAIIWQAIRVLGPNGRFSAIPGAILQLLDPNEKGAAGVRKLIESPEIRKSFENLDLIYDPKNYQPSSKVGIP